MLHIESIKVWNSATKEMRVYVTAWRGEKSASGYPVFHEGVRYVTGNHWQAKGTQEGDLTDEEWTEAKHIGRHDGKWTAYRAPVSAEILVKRPVTPETPHEPEREAVALTIGSREQVGAFAIITQGNDPLHERDQVLVCIASHYNAGDDEMNEEAGYYNSYAEPTEAEKQSPEYQQLLAKIADDRAYEQRQRDRIVQRHQAALDAIRAEGREPTPFEKLFAGTSDN